MGRLKVLLSAYSCEPGKGSESGIGWNVACGMAGHHDVWVLTRAQNRRRIEPFLSRNPVPGLTISYHDLSGVPAGWDGENSLCGIHYPFWQLSLYAAARRLHRQVGFDIAQHVTWGRHWAPSMMSRLNIPFIWGPVGGGESTPPAFLEGLGARGRITERCRNAARWIGEHDPFVRLTAQRCALALATTAETAQRLRGLQVREVRLLGHAALNRAQVDSLAALKAPPPHPFRFISMGRLLHWKGFHLGLQAFAKANLPDAEYVVVGDGPQRPRLQDLAHRLGIAGRVTFTGWIPRNEALTHLERSHVLVHPSFHDSGGWVCIEAMAAGRPVLCLDLGGPATIVDARSGVKIPSQDPAQAVIALASEMQGFAREPQRLRTLGASAREVARTSFLWEHRVDAMAEIYAEVLSRGSRAQETFNDLTRQKASACSQTPEG
jgi:glycosyltransferase involved in cell wall biosynthesis